MKRALRLATLVVATLVAWAVPARADIIDWLQELSGPGPFHEAKNKIGSLATFCSPGGGHLIQSFDAAGRQISTPCFFFDFRNFVSVEDDNFPQPVSVRVYDIGLSWRVARPVEIGIGVGVMDFKSDAPGATGAVRAELIAPRVVVKPILFIPYLLGNRDYWNSRPGALRWASVLKWYTRESVLLGTVTAGDFGAQATSSFRAKNDRLTSAGFILDFSELYEAIHFAVARN